MKLNAFKFLTDENIPILVCNYLKDKGFDVVSIGEINFLGFTDEDILAFATAEHRVIITQDSDFGTLTIAENKPFLGIIYLKPGHILPKFTIIALETIFETLTEHITTPFIIVAKYQDKKVKIRLRAFGN